MSSNATKRTAIAAMSLIALALHGCASPSEPTCGTAAVGQDTTPREVTVLADDLTSLQQAFDAQASRWRVLSLVSPTCSECILGAEAVEQEITSRIGPDELAALVVWIPMLPTDDEAAAHSSATIFPQGRALHFYDSEQSLGWAYARHTFKGFMERALKHLSDDDPLADSIYSRADVPQWDLYMLYAPGVKWGSESAPPLPTHWIRHTGRRYADGISIYWRDTPDAPPLRGDLFEAMREMANEALSKPMTTTPPASLRIEVLGLADCPNVQEAWEVVSDAVRSLALRADVQRIDQTSLDGQDARRAWPSPTILVDGRDLFGVALPAIGTSSCRHYPHGAPTAAEVAAALGSWRHR